MWRYFFGEENRKWRWRFCFGAPLYAIIFMYFQPLKGNIVNYNYPAVYDLAFLLITILYVYFSTFFLPKLFKSFFKRETWTIKRFYIWFISFALVGAFLATIFDIYTTVVNNRIEWTFDYLLYYQIPISCFTYALMLVFFLFYDPYLNLNTENRILSKEETSSTVKHKETILQVKDTNERVELPVNLENLYFFKASDNYIEIFHKNTEGSIESSLGTL
jgi:hypothetical protein